jgi:hypothetical protein
VTYSTKLLALSTKLPAISRVLSRIVSMEFRVSSEHLNQSPGSKAR